MKPVIVRWTDAWFDSEETTVSEMKDRHVVTTVGFVVREDAAVLSLASEVLPDDVYRAVTHIPQTLVIDRRDLDETIHVVGITA